MNNNVLFLEEGDLICGMQGNFKRTTFVIVSVDRKSCGRTRGIKSVEGEITVFDVSTRHLSFYEDFWKKI